MLYRILIWGQIYNMQFLNQIKREAERSCVQIVAIISKSDNYFGMKVSYPIIQENSILDVRFDYIIVPQRDGFIETILYLKEVYNISEDKIICGDVFLLPNFSFEEYIHIKLSNISIISDSCFGGFIYHTLGLKFQTPLINTRILPFDYIKFIDNLPYYLSCKLENYRKDELSPVDINSWLTYVGEPVGCLDDIVVRFVHENSFEEALCNWNKRINRINKDNTIVMMVIENQEIAERFLNVKAKRKIGFYYREIDHPEIVYIKEWQDPKIRRSVDYNFRRYIHRAFFNTFTPIDIIKLLSGKYPACECTLKK